MSRGRPVRVGTHGDYYYARREKCSCEPCIISRRRYDKRVHVDAARGNRRRVDAAPVREHVTALLQSGATVYQVARATEGKVVEAQITRLLYGNAGKEVTYLLRPTVEALLAVTARHALTQEGMVPGVGVQRRLQALQYLGYTVAQISEGLGVSHTRYYDLMAGGVIMNSTRLAVDELYQQWGMTLGTNNRSRWDAYRKGWVPPMAWDDHTIDDPNAEPDMTALACVVTDCPRGIFKKSLCRSHYYEMSKRGGNRSGERYSEVVHTLRCIDRSRLLSDVTELKELGYNIERTAMRLGKSPRTIERVWKAA